jgi:phosphohistidine phosphatase
MRHAKSDWSIGGQPDFERTLNARGQKAAPAMGKFLKDTGYTPHAIISSTAVRAKTTTILMAEKAGAEESLIQYEEQLYYAGHEEYLSAAHRFDEKVDIGMIVGHNPLVEQFIRSMCALDGNSGVMMPTAGIACIQLHQKWSDVRPGSGRLKWFMIPRLLERMD